MKETVVPVFYSGTDPSEMLGESVVRHIISCKEEFFWRTGQYPEGAFNSIPSVQSRGLVQLLSGSGFAKYLFLLPGNEQVKAYPGQFKWIGFDGSSILASQVAGTKSPAFHGVDDISQEPFSETVIREVKSDLSSSDKVGFVPNGTLKKRLNKLEHKFFTAEKLISAASFSMGHNFPSLRMNEAAYEILQCLFPDEDIRNTKNQFERFLKGKIDNTEEIIEEELESFLLSACGTSENQTNREFPFILLNPHPFAIDTLAEVESLLRDTDNETGREFFPHLSDAEGKTVAAQAEKQGYSDKGPLRVKIVFRAVVPAGGVAAYRCILKESDSTYKEEPADSMNFTTGSSKLKIDPVTGFPSVFEFMGTKLLGNEGMSFSLVKNSMHASQYRNEFINNDEQLFKLIDPALNESSPADELIPQISSEGGAVRSIRGSFFECGNSSVQVRYFIPAGEPWFDMEIAVHRLEEGNTLKWSIPSGYNMNCTGRVISGINCFKHRKREYLFRDWLCMKNFEGEASLSICADGAYSYDITGNRVNISLMQVQADGNNRGGSGIFRFRFIPGYTGEIMDNSFNNADLFNNPPLQLKGCHTGRKNGMYSGIAISDSSINLQSVMLNEKGDLVIRLLNPTKEKKRFNIRIPGLPGHAEIEIEAKMIKTLIAGKLSGRITETDLYERKQ